MQNYLYIIIGLFSSISAIYNWYQWHKKREIQNFINNIENKDLKVLALATNTIGWVAGNKFGKDNEKYYYYAINSLSNYSNLIQQFPTNDNLKENAFNIYKILKEEMRKNYSKKEIELSQIWAAMEILDVKNYVNNLNTPEDVDKQFNI